MRRIVSLALLGLTACWRVPAPPPELNPFAGAQLWLSPLKTYDGVWFPDELAPVEDALAAALERQWGFQVTPPEQLRRQWAMVQQGRLPGRRTVCDAAPPPGRLTQVLMAHARHGEPELRCEAGSCQVELPIYGPGGPEAERVEEARFALPVAPGSTPAQWVAALEQDRLTRVPVPEDGMGGFGVGGLTLPGRAPGLYVVLNSVDLQGTWTEPLEAGRFEAVKADLHACRQPGAVWRDWWGQPFQIELSPAGEVTRCEYPHVDHLPPPAYACQCAQLRKVGFGPGAPGRRARFYLDLTELKAADPNAPAPDPLYRSAYLAERTADDESAVLGTGEVRGQDLAACLAPVTAELPELRVPVALSLDAEGRVVRQAVAWGEALSPELHRCLEGVLAGARFNCPLSGKAEVQAQLSLSVQRRR
jgi:hypothetical protein